MIWSLVLEHFFDDTVKNQKDFGHYFCKIDSKISAFMHDLDRELWKVGILAKIQHNEVAPLQHEIVAVYGRKYSNGSKHAFDGHYAKRSK